MNSQLIKQRIWYEYLFCKGYLGAVMESYWNSDVLAISKKLFTIEFEVKVSKADLVGETRIIQALLAGNQEGAWTKMYKHKTFLISKTSAQMPLPNFFYFAVPSDLITTALIGTKNTPYGVASVDLYNVSIVRKASPLHKTPLSQAHLLSLLRETCIENYTLLQKLQERSVKHAQTSSS